MTWVKCKSYPGWEVNEDGVVRRPPSSKYDNLAPEVCEDGYIYGTPRLSSNGYYCFGFDDRYTIHRAVAEAFIPNPNNLPCVNHKDGDKTNNAISNLKWVTFQENSQHAARTGLIKTGKDSHLYGKTGDQHPCHNALLGNQWNCGKTYSEERCSKISNKMKGNKNGCGPRSPEFREKMKQVAKEREAKKKLIKQQLEEECNK